jgi:hypothetical protein
MIRINFDALLARIVYVWRWQAIAGTFLLLVAAILASGLIPPIWRGEATLAVSAPAGATLTLDRRPWPATIYAGAYTVAATLPDGRSASARVVLGPGERLDLALPAGLPPPRARPLPPPAPGMRVEQVWWADGGWRIRSAPILTSTAEPDPGAATPTPAPAQTVALGPLGTERLSTLDAYAGLADQLRVEDRLLEAVHRPAPPSGFATDAPGSVEVRGWPGGRTTVPLSDALTLVRFAPDGASLLLAERALAGEQVSLVQPNQPRAPLVAVPGSIRRLSWHDDGSAVVIHSRVGDRLALTLVRLRPTIAAATVAELDTARFAADLVPLTWDAAGLLWVAPDADDTPALWAAPLDTLVPEPRGPLDARALDWLPDGTLRAVVFADGQVAIGRFQGPIFITEIVTATIPPADDLVGIWRSNELLLQSESGAWLLALDTQAGD